MTAQIDIGSQRWERSAIKIRKSKIAPDILTWKTGRMVGVTYRNEKIGKDAVFGANNSKYLKSTSHVPETFPTKLTFPNTLMRWVP